ncbi:MAG: glycosyltransferase family 87 protein [Acidimicrobiales bacterium]
MLTDRLRIRHRAPPDVADRSRILGSGIVGRIPGTLRGLSPEGRDAVCYAVSAVFAAVTAFAVSIPLYRQWGQMAVVPYAVAASLMSVVAWRLMGRAGSGDGAAPAGPGQKARLARVVAFLIVLVGATLVPLSLEVLWRSEGNAALHVQPEVVVVETAGARAAQGRDPYRLIDRHGHILVHESGRPTYELYYPYLPGMVLFGLSSGTGLKGMLTDARVQFLLFTGLVAAVALSRIRPRTDARVRVFQSLLVLPTAALPLATGGDDLPVVALMLLGLVGLQRRRPLLAGLAIGAAASLKFTAWPLLVLAAWAAYDLHGRRRVRRYVLGAAAVIAPVVLPFALSNPAAFVDNVIRFPLGLAGVSSPAASALPGHILVSLAPGAHTAYVVAVGILGAVATIWLLFRHPPRTPAAASAVCGWLMLAAILLAPATRVGYLLYPFNLFVWAWMLDRSDDPSIVPGEVRSPIPAV